MVKVSQIYESTVMHPVLHVKISWLNLCHKIAFRKKKIFSLCLQAKNASGKKNCSTAFRAQIKFSVWLLMVHAALISFRCSINVNCLIIFGTDMIYYHRD